MLDYILQQNPNIIVNFKGNFFGNRIDNIDHRNFAINRFIHFNQGI